MLLVSVPAEEELGGACTGRRSEGYVGARLWKALKED